MVEIVAILLIFLILMLLSLNLTVYQTREDIPNIAETQSSTTANWQSGTATSGSTGGDLVTISISEAVYINFLEVVIGTLTNGATITIRLYHDVNGTSRNFYNEDFTVGTDPASIPVIDGSMLENGNLRVEVQSNQAGDNGSAISYEYK